jgi:hypothetical protein
MKRQAAWQAQLLRRLMPMLGDICVQCNHAAFNAYLQTAIKAG